MTTGIILDHRGSPIASVVKPEQKTALRVRAKFDAAQTTDENRRHWVNADHLGPNSELDPYKRRVLVSRSRYECANNTYASGMLRTLANDTIGTGPSLQVLGVDRASAYEIENRFWDWCLAVRLPEKLRLMRLAKARDGETFAEFTTNRRSRSPVKLDLVPFEAEMVASSVTAFASGSLLDGLVLDDFGNVIAYRVLREHPGDFALFNMTGEADLIRAEQILHLYNMNRPGQLRGCPEIVSALPLYAMLRDFSLAVLRCAQSAATPSWLVKTQGIPDSGIDNSIETMDVLETERGMGLILPGGWDMSQLRAEQPTSTYPQFKREIIAEIARCLGMPYNVAAGDSSSYNYSSGRLDHRTYYKALRVERSYIECNALDVIFAKWFEEARLINGYLPDQFSGRDAVTPAHEWRWDGDEHVDPTKEADATVTRIVNGLTDIGSEVARLGGDVSIVHQKNADILGLSLQEYRARLADKFFGAPAAVPATQDAAPQDQEQTDGQ